MAQDEPPFTLDPKNFTLVRRESHADIAGELAAQIKDVIYRRSDQIPLALAIGVLRIVEKELLDEA